MSKPVKARLTILALAGKATPAPPVGPALGAAGVNIGTFIQEFNQASSELMKLHGDILVPAIITVYEDRTYSFVLGTPPTSQLILKAAKISKGSPQPNRTKVGKITKEDAKNIAEQKLADLNTNDLNSAMRIVCGTAKSMGIDIV